MANQNVKFVTPKIRLAYPKLNAPDTKWKPDGEYVAKGVLLDGLPAATSNKIDAMLLAFVEEKRKELTERKQAAKAKALKVRGEFVKPETDGDTGEETGNFVFQAKMKASGINKKGQPWTRKPKIIDSKCKELPNPPAIWGGTEAKLAVTAACYYAPNDNVCGVTFYLEAVQIIKLVSNGAGDAKSMGFAEEDGFESSTDETAATFTDESTTDEGSSDGGGSDVEDF